MKILTIFLIAIAFFACKTMKQSENTEQQAPPAAEAAPAEEAEPLFTCTDATNQTSLEVYQTGFDEQRGVEFDVLVGDPASPQWDKPHDGIGTMGENSIEILFKGGKLNIVKQEEQNYQGRLTLTEGPPRNVDCN